MAGVPAASALWARPRVDRQRRCRWDRVTILGALGLEGILGAMSLAAATDGAVFHTYLEQVLLPELRRVKPGAVLIMDNLNAHKTSYQRP
jgi:hypothetical protein